MATLDGGNASSTYSTTVTGGSAGTDFSGNTPTGAYWDFGSQGSTGRVSVANNGNAEAYPDLMISGGLSGGFVITDVTTGQVVSIARQVPLGSTVTINQRTGAVTLDDGGDISAFLTSYDFFAIGPGEVHDIQFSPIGSVTGSPQLTVRMKDAYL